MRPLRVTMLVLTLAIAASPASAARFKLIPTPVAAYHADFTPIPGPPDLTTLNGMPRVFQFDIRVITLDLQPGERGFGSISFNIELDAPITEAGAGDWAPNTETTDSNGATSGGIVPLFSTNADAGTSPMDLQGISVSIAGGIANPNASDQRVKIGQPGSPSTLGSVFILWNGTSSGGALRLTDPVFSTYLTDGTFAPGQGAAGYYPIPQWLEFDPYPSVFPEPASAAMAGAALIGMIAFVRGRNR